MPTILEIDGIRVMLLPRDHPPPHVHMFSPEGSAKLHLNCPDGPLEEHENTGFTLRKVCKVKAALEPLLAQTCAQWKNIHGKY
jgi:hypothetical protein